MKSEIGLSGLLKSSAIYGISSGLSKLLGLLMLPIFTAYLSPAEFGIAGFLISLGALLLPVLSFGITASLSVCYFNEDDEMSRGDVFAAAAILLSLSAMLMVPLGYFCGNIVSLLLFEVPDYSLEVFIIFLGFAASLAGQTWLLRSQLLNRPSIYAFSNVSNVVVGLSVSWFLVAIKGYGALGLLVGHTIGHIVQLLCLIYGNRDARFNSGKVWPMILELIKQGLPLIPGFGFLYLIQNAVRWPVQRVGGLEDLGLLNVAMTLGAGIGVITSAVATAWLPYAMSYKDSWFRASYKVSSSFNMYYAFGCLLVSLLAVTSLIIITVMTDEKYLLSAKLIGLSSCFTFFLSIYSLLQLPLYLNDKVKYNSIPQGVAAIFTAVTFVFVFFDVLIGAGLSLLLGAVFLIAFQQVMVFKLAPEFVIPIKTGPVIRMTLVMFVVIAASMLDEPYYYFDSFEAIFIVSMALLVYFIFESGLKYRGMIDFFKRKKVRL